MSEHRVLCFGDSNTWGSIPAVGKRHPRDVRWVSRMGQILGDDCDVISEGLSGRTAVGPDPVMRLNSAFDDLVVSLRSHKPIDCVVLMLGTNDFKRRFGLSEFDITTGIAHLVDLVLTSNEVVGDGKTRLVLVAPLSIRLDGDLNPAQRQKRIQEFGDAVGVSERLPAQLRQLAVEKGCEFVDPNQTLKASEIDAIHWDAKTHIAFVELIADALKR